MPTEQNKTFDVKYDVVVTDGIITFLNANTTLGFVRFKNTGAIEYIYVQPMYRRLGLATRLLQQVKDITGQEATPEPPVSPLGRILFNRKVHD
jgi:GNAT superfamily N-acetyltransferase